MNEWNSEEIRIVFPYQNLCQLSHQCLVLRMNMALYVSASETETLYCAVINITYKLMVNARLGIGMSIGTCVDWAHGTATYILPAQIGSFWNKVIRSHFGMWVLVNRFFLEHGPIRTIKLFRNELQTFYSKNKCGVDWLTRFRSVLRSPT